MAITFTVAGGGEQFSYTPEALIIAGFTARNRTVVEHHMEELRAIGVPIPAEIPTFYPVPASLLIADPAIEVTTPESSGEVEPVLLARGDEWFIALGSDHTARDMEAIDIGRSKAACPKIVTTDLWRYAEVKPHWDQLTLRCWTVQNGARVPYQHGTCADIMQLEELVRVMRARKVTAAANFVMPMGTLPLLDGKFVFAKRFELELEDPVLDRRLTLGYDVTVYNPAD